MKKKKEDNHYVTNDEILEEMDDYKESGVISNKLGGIFIKISSGLASKGSYAGYTWKRDMINEAVYTCIRYAHNFDTKKLNKSNAFGYFNMICYHSFLNYIKKQKKHSKIKDILFNNAYVLTEQDQYMKKAIDYSSLK